MAATLVLTRGGCTLMEIQHAFIINNGHENAGDLKALSYALKKLQNDLNSCLTEVMMQETSGSQLEGKTLFGLLHYN